MKKLLLLLIVAITACQKKEQVDLLVVNATIYTVDSAFSTAEAMAIRDGKIVAVGTSEELEAKFSADSSWDANGSFIYPGFFDAHCHFSYYGLGLQQVDLTGTTSWEAVLSRLDSFAAIHPQGWIIGRGWDQNDWQNNDLPERSQLDLRFPNRPVYLTRIDGHAAVANGEALRLAGITANTRIAGGEIQLANQQPNGILIDNATTLMDAVVPKPDVASWRRALLDAQERCLAVGLTTVAEAGLDCLQIVLMQQLEQEGLLKIGLYPMISATSPQFEYLLAQGVQRSDRVHVRGVKFYADGALGSRGALLHEPYHDHGPHKGLLLTPKADFLEKAERLYQAGFQVNTHCIGDSANTMVLNWYEQVVDTDRKHRWRIEHAQLVRENDQERFAALAVIPSVQPTHATSDMYWAEERIGSERIRYAYPYQDLLRKTGLLALGTDFPVEGIDPLKTFYAAIFRQDVKGWPEGGFTPQQRLTREQALRGMTIWAAYAQFEEKEKGSLEKGKNADFVVLDKDLLKAEREELLQTKVLNTVVNGKLVFTR
jgi:hypothetical protein